MIFVFLLFRFLAHSANLFLSNAAIPNPDFWDATQEELDDLVAESAPFFRPVEDMGNNARLCNQLPGYENETAYKLRNVTVLIMDEELICQDFPSTCNMSSEEKEAWLIERAGWFSAEHIAAGVNKDIPYDKNQSIPVRRACAAGRALLLPTAAEEDEPGAIDVKGLGAKRPIPHNTAATSRAGSHHDGLFALYESLYEYMNEKTIAAVLDDHFRKHPITWNDKDISFNTVGIYAVMSLGFYLPVITEKGTKYFVASGLVRQASRRHPNPHGWMDYHEAQVLEQILNAYGIRSDGPQNNGRFAGLPNPHCRRINLQGTFARRTLTDFGNFQGGSARDWPPKGECLVHWGETGSIINTVLWDENFGIGSPEVRDFLREEYKMLPSPESEGRTPYEYEFIRHTNNARMRKAWGLENCWWNGECSIAHVRKEIHDGMIDEALFSNGNWKDTCQNSSALSALNEAIVGTLDKGRIERR